MNNYNFVKPNYYAILPATVRYDKSLTASAKLLYAEISALCNKEGRCWATNNYFAQLYGMDQRSIRRLVQSLVAQGYIKITIENKEKDLKKRYIKLADSPDKIVLAPPDKNVLYNNTSINNKFIVPTIDELEEYKNKKGYQCDVKQFADYHSSKGWIVGKVKMKDWRRALSYWESNDKKRKNNYGKAAAKKSYAASIYDYEKATDF